MRVRRAGASTREPALRVRCARGARASGSRLHPSSPTLCGMALGTSIFTLEAGVEHGAPAQGAVFCCILTDDAKVSCARTFRFPARRHHPVQELRDLRASRPGYMLADMHASREHATRSADNAMAFNGVHEGIIPSFFLHSHSPQSLIQNSVDACCSSPSSSSRSR